MNLPPVTLNTLQAFLDLLPILRDPQKLEGVIKTLAERQAAAEQAEANARHAREEVGIKARETNRLHNDLTRNQQTHAHNVAAYDAEKKTFNRMREEQETKQKQQDQKEARLHQNESSLLARERDLERREKELQSGIAKLVADNKELADRVAEAKRFLKVA